MLVYYSVEGSCTIYPGVFELQVAWPSPHTSACVLFPSKRSSTIALKLKNFKNAHLCVPSDPKSN